MTSAPITRPLSFAGAPASAWAFGIRIWAAVVVALAASFWLELEAPSTAALTVAILATPTRGEALHKASYRLMATVIGVTAAIAITALFSQARDLLIAAFAAWIGLCVYAATLMDGNRAYAAVLSGYTVAFVAIQQIDTAEHVFETGMARGAAIAVGIAAVALVNDLLAAPDTFPRVASQLAALHGRVRDYTKPVPGDEAADAATAAGLLRDIAALRPDIASLAPESASGAVRGAAARSAAVALAAEVYAARARNAPLDPSAAPVVRGLGPGIAGVSAARHGSARSTRGVERRHATAKGVAYAALSITTHRRRCGNPGGGLLRTARGLLRLRWVARGGRLPVAGRRRDRIGRHDARSKGLHGSGVPWGADRGSSGGRARVFDPRRGQRLCTASHRARALHDRSDGADDPAQSAFVGARSPQPDLHSGDLRANQSAVLRRAAFLVRISLFEFLHHSILDQTPYVVNPGARSLRLKETGMRKVE
jgi:hypothetical protein